MATAGLMGAADIGGTFTDVIVFDPARGLVCDKVLSTPEDYSQSVLEGVRLSVGKLESEISALEGFSHATTVATNAVLQRTGALTGLITTAGFRDVLEIRRMRFPDTYNLFWEKPEPLVERYLRQEIAERMGADGAIVTPLDRESVVRAVANLVEAGVESLAICLVNAYVNASHERAVREIVAEMHPELPVSLSSDIWPQMNEYERTSTTVANAYVTPTVATYLEQLSGRMRAAGSGAPIYVMQSNGGMMTLEAARRAPVHLLESGPAAGVVGALAAARRLGYERMITFDMGGTTAKASTVDDFQIDLTEEYEIGAPISLASRVLKGGGYILSIPSIDLAEVGAGGGSIVYRDELGLHVGPRSAGSAPGPACYGRGGTEPTLTDANVVLGYLSPATIAGGTLAIDADKARSAIGALAEQIGESLLDTAFGITRIANATMGRAIRAVSVSRGKDPRDSVLLAFGGNGPMHAVPLARGLGMRSVVVPPLPGVFSALGLLYADVERHGVRSVRLPLSEASPVDLEALYRELEREARAELAGEGWAAAAISADRFAECRYIGQSHAISVPVADDMSAGVAPIVSAFDAAHERSFGHSSPGQPAEVVNVRVIARVKVRAPELHSAAVEPPSPPRTRSAYFGEQWGLVETPLLARSALTDVAQRGPLIVEEYDATTLVPPYAAARLDVNDCIVIDVDLI